MALKPLFTLPLIAALLVLGAAPPAPVDAAVPHPTLLNARALAMGGAVRALAEPVESARLNPAGLATRRGFFAGSSYATRRRAPYDAFSLTLIDNITSPMGGALQYQRTTGPTEEREEVGLGLAVGKPGLRWGFTTRYVHGRDGREAQWHNVFNGDLGVLFERPGGIRLAVVGYDLLGTSLEFLARKVACGVGRSGLGSWSLEADLVRNLDLDFADGLDLHLGAEYRHPRSPWIGRLGQMWRGDNDKDYPSAGFAYQTGRLDLGYAVQLARQERRELLHLFTVDGSF